MKNIVSKLSIFVLVVVSVPASLVAKGGVRPEPKSAITVAPSAPTFSMPERHRELATRRKKIAGMLEDNSMLILFSAKPKLYAGDVDYNYRQENNLYYLTALKRNGSTLVITKNAGVIKEFIFLPKRNPRFETWNGRMYSNEEAKNLSGIETIISAGNLRGFLRAVEQKQAFSAKDGSYASSFVPEHIYLLRGSKREYGAANNFAANLKDRSVRNAIPLFARLRIIKSPYEIKLVQHAVDITEEAIGRSMGMIGRARWEYQVQAEVEYTFRRRNADFWGYGSIVGCGANATTLHYVESQGKVNKGELMLMDVGAEYDHYTADVTRTFPVNGKFTKEQAEIYQIVYDAQEAAASKLKPGSSFRAASIAAQKVIVDGLFKLGLITDKNSGQYRIWYMHGWGHWLGMNVHDVGSYGGTLKEGMIMTNEPGLYFREDALDNLRDTPKNREFIAKVRPIFEKYKNIGVRIEDDMLITASGVDWMTKDLPRSIKDVEDFMSKASKEMRGIAGRRHKTTNHLGILAQNPLDNAFQKSWRKKSGVGISHSH